MKGWIVTRETADGSKRYHASWRVGSTIKTRTFQRRKDADRYLTNVVKHVQDGTYVELTPITFKAYAEQWLEGLGQVKPSTRASYSSVLTHQLIPAFGDTPLTALTVEAVNAWLASREATLKPKTLRNCLTLLHKLLADATEGGYLRANRLHQSKALRRPRALREGDEADIEVLEPREVHALLDALPPSAEPLFRTAVCTGLRLGELLALQWGDLDRAAGKLHVRRTAYKGGFYVPKSKKSRRAVDLGDQLLGALRAWQRAQHGETAPAADALVFPSATGAPLDPDNLRHRVWAPALAKAELRHVRIHSLRHTFASMLIAQGENPKYISAQLGHASVQITLDRYGHLFPDERRGAAARFEAQLEAARPSSIHPAEGAETAGNTVEQDAVTIEEESTPRPAGNTRAGS
jgi:integrase